MNLCQTNNPSTPEIPDKLDSTQNIFLEPNIESCAIQIIYSFTNVEYIGIINCKIYEKNFLLVSEFLSKLAEYVSITDFQIFLFDNYKKSFILIGIYPNKIIQKKIFLNQTITNIKSKGTRLIKLKFRQIINKDNALRMEFAVVEENEPDEEKSIKSSPEKGEKSRRSKERKIGSVIKKVYMWRKMYTGFKDENDNLIKLTLEEAAKKVGISKKSLDDYLIQLRAGRNLGFNFNEHQNDKIGVLRSFVKQNKK